MPLDPESITRRTAIRRYADSRRIEFIKLYDRWNASIGQSPALEADDTHMHSPLSLAAQVEAYAALRRREAFSHQLRCTCIPCTVRRYHEARHAMEQRAA